MQDELWKHIGAFASFAPSTHNTQGWRIRVTSELGAELLYENKRTLPAEDIHGDFNIINMGIFERALEIGAAASGYTLRYQFVLPPLTYRALRYTCVAMLSLEKSDANPDALLRDVFYARRTSRIPYNGKRVDEETLQLLTEFAKERNQGHTFCSTQNPEDVRFLVELNADTIAEDLQNQSVRKELHQWTRYTKGQARHSRDGLWTTCMNQNAFLTWWMTKYPQILKIGWVKQFFKKRYLKTQSGTPAVGWIAGSIATRKEQFEAGRFLLDFWLALTRLKLWILPYGSLYTNETSNKKVGERIGAPNFWLIFRMGCGETPPESYRLAPEELFIRKGGPL